MKYAIAILAIVMLTGCSSKVVTWDSMGEKTVTTRTNEDLYHEAQAKAWVEYYKALQNTPVLAEIEQKDGSVLKIYSQAVPAMPKIYQHQNQYIKPVTDVLKWGIGGVVVDRGLRAIVKGTGDIITENSGDGTVYVDKSDSIASKTDASFSTDTDSSDNSDNSLTNPDPLVVEQPEYNDPIIVQPEVVRPEIVNPVIVPQE